MACLVQLCRHASAKLCLLSGEAYTPDQTDQVRGRHVHLYPHRIAIGNDSLIKGVQ